MVANIFVRLLIFIMYFTYVSFSLQYSGLTSWVDVMHLINSKLQAEDCNIPVDHLALSVCDKRLTNIGTVQSDYFRDEIYLCMGVYDVVLHICSLEKKNLSITSSIKEIIKEMDGETKSEIYGVSSICQRMKTMKYEAASMELGPWLNKLNNTLQNNCEHTCINNHEVNPLCIFLLWGNELYAEQKLEKDNVADVNVNTVKLPKKADEKTLNSGSTEKSLRQPKVSPPSTAENNVFNINELNGNQNKLEEVTSKRQEDPQIVDGQNYYSLLEDEENKISEPKISTSAETDAKLSLTTSSSNEAVQHLEINKNLTNFGGHLKGDMSSVKLREQPTSAWKSMSFTESDIAELTDPALPSMHRKHFDNAEDSHFFAYFLAVVAICIFTYLIYHNKHKLLALILEGRRRRELRRTSHGGYRKLDSSLEEAVNSTCSTSVTHVIY